MSFQATHIQFALKVKDLVRARNLTKYLSGTIYPDSRYLTGIERKLTHNRMGAKLITSLNDDFIKGWQVHLWYDNLSLPYLGQISLGRQYQENDMENFETWIKVTSAKLIEDLFWWKNTDWNKVLPCLKFISNPNKEELTTLQNWYKYFFNFYLHEPNLEVYEDQAKFMGIGLEKIVLIQESSHILYNDKNKRSQIEKVMDQIVEKFRNLIISK